MNFKTYPMPLDDRIKLYGDLYQSLIPYTIGCVVAFIILFICIGICVYKNIKSQLLILLASIAFFVSIFLIGLTFYQKLLLVNNINNTHYATLNGKGTVTYVHDSSYDTNHNESDDNHQFNKDLKYKDIKTVYIKSNDSKFVMKINKDINIKQEDRIKIKTNRKIPINNSFDKHKLNFISNDITCYVQHNGKWSKIDIPYLNPELYTNKYKMKD